MASCELVGFDVDADYESPQDVRQRVTLEALVVPFQEGAGATVCAAREPGFITPASWGIEARSAEAVSFWLEAAGRRGITFDGDRWSVVQNGLGSGGRAATSWAGSAPTWSGPVPSSSAWWTSSA